MGTNRLALWEPLVDKTFENITSVTFLGIQLDCETIRLHYPPDTISSGATGFRTRTVNHAPGTLTATLFADSEGLKQLSKKMLAGRGHGLDGTLEIAAKDGPYSFEDASMVHLDERTRQCKFSVGR